MNTKVLVVFLIFCVLTAQAGPYCALCTNIIAGVQKDYNNDFTNVTADDLEKDIDRQCDAQTSNNLEDAMCKQLAAQGELLFKGF